MIIAGRLTLSRSLTISDSNAGSLMKSASPKGGKSAESAYLIQLLGASECCVGPKAPEFTRFRPQVAREAILHLFAARPGLQAPECCSTGVYEAR